MGGSVLAFCGLKLLGPAGQVGTGQSVFSKASTNSSVTLHAEVYPGSVPSAEGKLRVGAHREK